MRRVTVAGASIAMALLAGGGTAALSSSSTPYRVGAAMEDITPTGTVNVGGNGLGDGSTLPDPPIERGGQAKAEGERIRTRAVVFDDGRTAVALASIETTGVFAAYQRGPYGVSDMAAAVAKQIRRLPKTHILISSNHSHSGPDTIGAWGGVPESYLRLVRDRTIRAITRAYAARRPASVRVGESNASDLIYNQSCSEGLNQSRDPVYTGPEICLTPGKDGLVRVVQARDRRGRVIASYMAFAAHATAGGGKGLHGDWPQFLSDAMAREYGGVGIAVQGAVGSTQPCRPACSFTRPSNPGYNIADRKTAIVTNYMAHVRAAARTARTVTGPVAAAQTTIREVITSPAIYALFTGGHWVGARLLRSHNNPWVVGPTLRTVTAALRVGGVLFAGTPGEGYHAIGEGIRNALTDEAAVLVIGLANDQVGYLIAPASYYPVIAAQVAVNDNSIFNVSPTIGEHVMCSDIALARRIGFRGSAPAMCAPYDAVDAQGDPIAGVPIGGVVLPERP